MVYEDMQLQEKQYLTWTLGSRSHKMLPQYPHHMTYAPAKFEATTFNHLEEDMHLQEKTLFDLDLGVKVTQTLPSALYIM